MFWTSICPLFASLSYHMFPCPRVGGCNPRGGGLCDSTALEGVFLLGEIGAGLHRRLRRMFNRGKPFAVIDGSTRSKRLCAAECALRCLFGEDDEDMNEGIRSLLGAPRRDGGPAHTPAAIRVRGSASAAVPSMRQQCVWRP